MWHVDEGALHAYLDGALDEYPAAEARRVREHLDACPECAERLAAERRVREEAQDILSLAAPRVEVPTLEELRAYVKAQAPTRTKTQVRLYRLSWAASVVLALGTGWLLRGGMPQTTASGERGFAVEQVPASAASEPAERSSASEVAGPAPGSTGGAAPAAPDAVAGAQRVAPPAPAETLLELQAADARDGARAPAGPDPRRELAERQAPAAPAGAGAGAPAAALADADADAAASKAADDTAADVADAVVANVRAPATTPTGAPAPGPSSASAERTRQDSTQRDGVVSQRAAEQRVQSAITQAPTVTGLGAGTPALGRAADAPADVSADSAELDAESVSLVVPGLEVVDVLRIGQGTTFLGTRALQLLPSGDTLETAHIPPGVDVTVLPPLRAGWSEMIEPRGLGWIVLRAPLSPSALAELLERLEAGR